MCAISPGFIELSVVNELFSCQADIASYLAQQDRGNVPAGVVWNRGAATVGVPVLQMGASLPHQGEAKNLQYAAHLPWL